MSVDIKVTYTFPGTEDYAFPETEDLPYDVLVLTAMFVFIYEKSLRTTCSLESGIKK